MTPFEHIEEEVLFHVMDVLSNILIHDVLILREEDGEKLGINFLIPAKSRTTVQFNVKMRILARTRTIRDALERLSYALKDGSLANALHTGASEIFKYATPLYMLEKERVYIYQLLVFDVDTG